MAIERELGMINEKLENIEKLIEKQNGRVTKSEDRIDALQRWQSRLMGGAAVVGALLTAIWEKFSP